MMLYAAFTLGLIGSMHCLGMCGPIAMALPVRTNHVGMKTVKYLLYNAGRIMTYGALGLVVGFLGKGFAFAGLQQVLSVSLGALIISSVIVAYSPARNIFITTWMQPFYYKLKQAFLHHFKNDRGSNLFFLGLLNGFLPCGMIYIALAGALSTGQAMEGSLFMMAFGAGTVPLMMTASFIGSSIGHRFRTALNKLSPVLTILVGAFLILRGLNVNVPNSIHMISEHSHYKCH